MMVNSWNYLLPPEKLLAGALPPPPPPPELLDVPDPPLKMLPEEPELFLGPKLLLGVEEGLLPPDGLNMLFPELR